MNIEILLVEDSPADAELAKLTLSEGNIQNHVHWMQDGEEALDFLFKRGKFINAKRPNLILLDLNLPKVNGIEILNIIKQNENLRSIPVVMLTSSEAPHDVMEAYKAQVNCYITKPIDIDKFNSIINIINSFWLQTATLPR